jgi:hypothetical protein
VWEPYITQHSGADTLGGTETSQEPECKHLSFILRKAANKIPEYEPEIRELKDVNSAVDLADRREHEWTERVTECENGED